MKILALIALGDWQSLDNEPVTALPLVQRVRELALAAGAEVHFAHQVYDVALDTERDINSAFADKVRDLMMRDERECMEQLVQSFTAEGIPTTSSTQFVRVCANSVLDEISTVSPDLVIKISKDHSFLLGLFSNLDWELIRRSPVPVWFVKRERPDIRRMVTAIELKGADDDSEDDILDQAKQFSELLNTELTIVHACEPLAGVPVPAGLSGGVEVLATSESARLLNESRQAHQEKIQQVHGERITRLAARIGLAPDDIQLRQGVPAEVISAVAREADAGLIVMGARNMQRWERVFSHQHAEPVLADAGCDVLFVVQNDDEAQ